MHDFLPPALHGVAPEEIIAVIGGAIVIMALCAGLFGAWIGAYFGGRRGAKRAFAAMRTDSPAMPASQIEELRQAVDTIAVEVERIAEGQRFTARLLNERVGHGGATSHPRRDPGSVTPH